MRRTMPLCVTTSRDSTKCQQGHLQNLFEGPFNATASHNPFQPTPVLERTEALKGMRLANPVQFALGASGVFGFGV